MFRYRHNIVIIWDYLVSVDSDAVYLEFPNTAGEALEYVTIQVNDESGPGSLRALVSLFLIGLGQNLLLPDNSQATQKHTLEYFRVWIRRITSTCK